MQPKKEFIRKHLMLRATNLLQSRKCKHTPDVIKETFRRSDKYDIFIADE